jgi:hypothetical protein
MSHHHMLTPIVTTPQVKPKKLEPKKSRIQLRGAGSLAEADRAGETFEAPGFGDTAAAAPKSPLQNFAPIEGAEQKPQHPKGRLSESTLKTMLEVQEMQPGFA